MGKLHFLHWIDYRCVLASFPGVFGLTMKLEILVMTLRNYDNYVMPNPRIEMLKKYLYIN